MRRKLRFQPLPVQFLEDRQLLSTAVAGQAPPRVQTLVGELETGKLTGAAAIRAERLAQHYGISIGSVQASPGGSSTLLGLTPGQQKRLVSLEKLQANRQLLINQLQGAVSTPKNARVLRMLQNAQTQTANYITQHFPTSSQTTASSNTNLGAAYAAELSQSNVPVSGSSTGTGSSTGAGSTGSTGTSTSQNPTSQQIVQLVSLLGSFANSYTSGANPAQDQAALNALRVGINAEFPGTVTQSSGQSAAVDLLGGATIDATTIALLRGAVNAFETNYTYGANPTVDAQTLQNFGQALTDIAISIPTPLGSISTNKPNSSTG